MCLISTTFVILATTAALFAQDDEGAAKKAAATNSTDTNAPVVTPTTLPGAETFVYRDGKPDPMRLHVFKPKGWTAKDQRPALIFFFGGGWTKGTPERSASYAKWASTLGMVGVAPDYRTKERFDTSPLPPIFASA